METKLLSGGDARSLVLAAELLSAGELLAFPTETVYGLGADARSEHAVAAIYAAKDRPPSNPLIVHVRSLEAAERFAELDTRARRLADAFWPGPLTLVVRSRGVLPRAVTAGGETVALRSPRHRTARALLLAFGGPIAAPSANRSGGISPTTAAAVMAELEGRIPLVLDGGPCEVGIESTVIDLTGRPTILRPGSVPASELERTLAEPVGFADGAEAGPLRSPGRLLRHYAPRTRLVVGGKVPAGAVSIVRSPARGERTIEVPADPAGYARELYGALRQADSMGVAAIWIEELPAEESWSAIRDRIARAAAPE
ncbi:MAG: threonylcarbamoyl-AMP synthase [Deltaproteobacteria bacterium]|nr:threonylcarbamoyl-AMP synthase [Deltaproteobacteria bacterium]